MFSLFRTCCRHLREDILQENKLTNNLNITIASDIDNLPIFQHVTHEKKDAISIATNGFNFKRFGKTAKMYGMQDFMKHDPLAIFASSENQLAFEQGKPYVKFKLTPTAKVLQHNLEGAEIKKILHELTNPKNASDFNLKLRQMGIDAIHHMDNENELIVLNPNVVRIVEVGITGQSVILRESDISNLSNDYF